MQFLNLWAVVAGGLAIGAPVLIHLLTRARGTRFVYPTVRFVLEAITARRRFNRLRDWLVLALRTLLVAALALMFARLVWRSPEITVAGKGRWLVVVLDVSLSMGALADGATAFETAQHTAQDLLRTPGLREADLILAGQSPRAVFGTLSENLVALREEVVRANVRPEALDPSAALAAAAVSIQSLPEDARTGGEVVILSDLQRSNWATASFSSLPPEVPVKILNVRETRAAPENTALLRVWTRGIVSTGNPASVVVDLAHYGKAPRRRALELDFEDRVLRRPISFERTRRVQESFVITPTRSGPQVVRLRLTGERDALAADDTRELALNAKASRRIVLVSRKPTDSIGGGAYFLDRSLRASAAMGFEIERLGVEQLEGATDPKLSRADLLALVEPGRLSSQAVGTVARFLSRGMPVLYALGSPTDADAISELETVLGPAMEIPVTFAPLERNTAARFIVWADLARRPFKIFGAGLGRFTRELLLEGGLRSAPRGEDEEGHVLARLSDQSAGLVVVPAGLGRLTLLNLPLSGQQHLGKSALVVPLLQEIALDLMEGPERSRPREGICGRAFSLPLSTDGIEVPQEAWKVLDASGVEPEGPRIVQDEGGPMLLWNPADRPGAYRVTRREDIVEAFSIGVPPEESNLHSLDARVLKDRIARDRHVEVHAAGEVVSRSARDEETWPLFAGIALLCLFLELVVLKLLRT